MGLLGMSRGRYRFSKRFGPVDERFHLAESFLPEVRIRKVYAHALHETMWPLGSPRFEHRRVRWKHAQRIRQKWIGGCAKETVFAGTD